MLAVEESMHDQQNRTGKALIFGSFATVMSTLAAEGGS